MSFTINGTTGINLATQPLTGALPDANAPSGSVIQVVSATKTDTFTTTSTSLTDITGLSVTITPLSASNKILVLAYVTAGSSSASFSSIVLLRNSTEIFIGDAASTRPRATGMYYDEGNQGLIWSNAPLFLDSPATTSAVTYKFQARVGSGGGTFTLNRSPRDSDSTTYDFRTPSSITVMEIAA